MTNSNKLDFRLILSKKVDAQAKYLCKQLPRNEWSGPLFFTVEKQGNTVLMTAKDLFLEHIGSAGSTEFRPNSNQFFDYMLEKGYVGYQWGLIHSHNQMGTFFSSVDMGTLEEQGKENPTFLSVVTNNKSEYIAKITIRSKASSNSIVNLFGEEIQSSEEQIQVIIKDVQIELGYEDADIEDVKSRFEYLSAHQPITFPSFKPTVFNPIQDSDDNCEEPEIPFQYAEMGIYGKLATEQEPEQSVVPVKVPIKTVENLCQYGQRLAFTIMQGESDILPTTILKGKWEDNWKEIGKTLQDDKGKKKIESTIRHLLVTMNSELEDQPIDTVVTILNQAVRTLKKWTNNKGKGKWTRDYCTILQKVIEDIYKFEPDKMLNIFNPN